MLFNSAELWELRLADVEDRDAMFMSHSWQSIESTWHRIIDNAMQVVNSELISMTSIR
jgi:hypothetical protein